MTTTDEVRSMARKMLDGMSFNKEKLANGCLGLCTQNDLLKEALAAEKAKSTALASTLSAVQRRNERSSSSADFPQEFGDIFGDIFGSKGGGQPRE